MDRPIPAEQAPGPAIGQPDHRPEHEGDAERASGELRRVGRGQVRGGVARLRRAGQVWCHQEDDAARDGDRRPPDRDEVEAHGGGGGRHQPPELAVGQGRGLHAGQFRREAQRRGQRHREEAADGKAQAGLGAGLAVAGEEHGAEQQRVADAAHQGGERREGHARQAGAGLPFGRNLAARHRGVAGAVIVPTMDAHD
jgi:hypothetical protein